MGPRIAEWYTKVAAAVQKAIQCCRVISDRIKNYIKTSADCFFKCLVTQSCPTLCDCMDCSHHAPLSMEFSRQEYWNGLSCPPPGHLPNPGIEPRSPALQVDFFFFLPSEPPGKAENTGVGSLSCLLENFLAQELNQGLLHCRWIVY